MKKIFTFALIVLLVVVAASLAAQTLSIDKNGSPIPFGRTFDTITVAAADTTWKEVLVPALTYEAYIRATGGTMLVAADSLYGTIKYEIALTDTIGAVTLPVLNKSKIWIRRAAAGTASSLYILWKKF